MRRFIALLSLLMISFVELPTLSAQKYTNWNISASLRYVRRCYEQQNIESKMYGEILGELYNKEFLVSARSYTEAEKYGYEAASKVPGGMKYMYEGVGEYEGKPCHIYVFVEIESLTIELDTGLSDGYL